VNWHAPEDIRTRLKATSLPKVLQFEGATCVAGRFHMKRLDRVKRCNAM
jgi:hypothetical protein